jgi:hypothetical protein
MKVSSAKQTFVIVAEFEYDRNKVRHIHASQRQLDFEMNYLLEYYNMTQLSKFTPRPAGGTCKPPQKLPLRGSGLHELYEFVTTGRHLPIGSIPSIQFSESSHMVLDIVLGTFRISFSRSLRSHTAW